MGLIRLPPLFPLNDLLASSLCGPTSHRIFHAPKASSVHLTHLIVEGTLGFSVTSTCLLRFRILSLAIYLDTGQYC